MSEPSAIIIDLSPDTDSPDEADLGNLVAESQSLYLGGPYAPDTMPRLIRLARGLALMSNALAEAHRNELGGLLERVKRLEAGATTHEAHVDLEARVTRLEAVVVLLLGAVHETEELTIEKLVAMLDAVGLRLKDEAAITSGRRLL